MKMSEVIEFVSTFEMYEKEKSGRKPNTLRLVGGTKEVRLNRATHVRIRKGYTKECFTRKITDVTKWKGVWIISWNPNERKEEEFTSEVEHEMYSHMKHQGQLHGRPE